MIADTSTQLRQVAETFITMPEIRSRFLEQMEYNMKARAGINPSISNEEIANKRNEQIEEDNLAATENTLTQIDYSNPETLQSVLQNYRTYGALMKSNQVTAVIESFTDNEIADKIVSDDVYRINATNTDQDYPVYMTRGAIFTTQLLDRLNNDSPSISSFVKRFAMPPALAVAGHVMKGGVGLFVTHGATAAYDVTQLGTSIYNTQKKYHDWRNRLLDDKTLGYDQFMEETQKLLDDVVTNVPEEYRYEVYKGLYEGPDPFADIGNAFTGFGTDMAYIPAKAGYGFAKGTIKNIMPGIKQSTNVKKLDLNVDIVNKIKEMSTNKVNEEAVEGSVTNKASINAPDNPSEKTREVVRGIVRQQESDDNMLQNVSNDSVMPSVDVPVKKNRRDRYREAEIRAQKGEINLSSPEESVIIYHGKGVDNNPMTLEEAERELKVIAGRKGLPEIGSVFQDNEPEYIAISTASKNLWGPVESPAKAADVNPLGGEGSAMYGRGVVYASLVDDREASRGLYFKRFQNQLESEYVNKAEQASPYAIDNPYFWFKNAQSSLTKEEANIVKEIGDNDYTKDLIDYMNFDDNYRGLKFETQIIASDETLKQNLAETEEQIKDAIKEYKEAPFTTTAKYFVDLIAERMMLKKIIDYRRNHPLPEALLYTHSIANPNKHPEKYLRYELIEKGDGTTTGYIHPETDFYLDKGANEKQKDFINRIKSDAYSRIETLKDRVERGFVDVEDFDNVPLDNQAEYYNYVRLLDNIDESYKTGKDYFSIEDWNDLMYYASQDGFGSPTRAEFNDKIQREMYTNAGIDGLLHSDTNIVIFNEDAIMPVNKLEKGIRRKTPVDIYEQMLYDNGHGIVSAGDGVGYYIVERHSRKDAKPMVIRNYKIVDEGE